VTRAIRMLEEAAGWYRKLIEKAQKAGLSKQDVTPAATVFADVQRLVTEKGSTEQVQKLRELFLQTGLPVDGFAAVAQLAEAGHSRSSYAPGLWERIVAVVCAVLVLGVVLYVVVRNQPFSDLHHFQLLRVVLSLSVAT